MGDAVKAVADAVKVVAETVRETVKEGPRTRRILAILMTAGLLILVIIVAIRWNG